MQPAERLNAIPALPSLGKVRALVNDHLWGDWIIRVEHGSRQPGPGNGWQQWGEALFAVSDAQPVIDAIVACRSAHPDRSIRISARKVRPETSLVYWVHRADRANDLEEQPLPGAAPRPAVDQQARRPLAARIRAAGGAAWGFMVLGGALLGSLLMVQMSAN